MSDLPDRRDGDDPLARELEAMLAVDHSPTFRAAVRERVAREDVRAAWTAPWVLPAAAGAAALCAAALIVFAVTREAFIDAPMPAAPLAGLPVGPPPAPSTPSSGERAARHAEARVAPTESGGAAGIDRAAARSRPPASRQRRVSVESAPASRPPIVLIAADEAEALRRLLRDASEGRLELTADPAGAWLAGTSALAPATDDIAPASVRDEITIEPLAVPPLPPVEQIAYAGARS